MSVIYFRGYRLIVVVEKTFRFSNVFSTTTNTTFPNYGVILEKWCKWYFHQGFRSIKIIFEGPISGVSIKENRHEENVSTQCP
jgi:hypothetical protein